MIFLYPLVSFHASWVSDICHSIIVTWNSWLLKFVLSFNSISVISPLPPHNDPSNFSLSLIKCRRIDHWRSYVAALWAHVFIDAPISANCLYETPTQYHVAILPWTSLLPWFFVVRMQQVLESVAKGYYRVASFSSHWLTGEKRSVRAAGSTSFHRFIGFTCPHLHVSRVQIHPSSKQSQHHYTPAITLHFQKWVL